MATIIRVPELGIAIANVRLIRWCVSEGQSVARSQPLLEVETDKLSMEVPSEAEGTLLKVFFGPDAQMPTATPLAIVGAPGEHIENLIRQVETELKAFGLESLPMSPPAPVPAVETAPAPEPPASGRILATPLARRIAKERGIDLAQVRGTGVGGRITEQDVERHTRPASVPDIQSAAMPVAPPESEEETIPLRGARKSLADHMVQSVHTSPHFTLGTEVDCSRMIQLRSSLKEEFRVKFGLSLTFVPFVVKALALAVQQVPIVNATIRDHTIIIRKRAHVGVAVAVGDLIHVPVIRDPLSKHIFDIAREGAQLAELARTDHLTPSQVTGGTITVTNVGLPEFHILRGTAIINQPQVAILAMGKITDRVVAWNGAIAIRPMMDLVFSFDHRVVMGVPGARFAEQIKQLLEDPASLVEAVST